MGVWREVSSDEEEPEGGQDLELTVEQLDYLECGEQFKKLAGSLACWPYIV